MAEERVRFRFLKSVPIDEVEGTLRLACLAAEALHGTDRVQLEAKYAVERAGRTVTIHMVNEVGRDLALIFSGYARREFGQEAFEVRRPTQAKSNTVQEQVA